MALSKRMLEAISLLSKEEFYLREFPQWSFWAAYNLPGERIRTDTMEALERRGIIEIKWNTGKGAAKVAKLINPHYEELTASEYCIRCTKSYQKHNYRWICRTTGKIVVGMDGRATVNAMKCH